MEERRENLKMEYNGEIINNILPGTQIDSFKSSRAAYNVGHKKRTSLIFTWIKKTSLNYGKIHIVQKLNNSKNNWPWSIFLTFFSTEIHYVKIKIIKTFFFKMLKRKRGLKYLPSICVLVQGWEGLKSISLLPQERIFPTGSGIYGVKRILLQILEWLSDQRLEFILMMRL